MCTTGPNVAGQTGQCLELEGVVVKITTTVMHVTITIGSFT